MILVDVIVPSLGRRYDFNLDETVPVFVLLHEMLEVVGQKERCKFFEGGSEVSLYSKKREARLAPEKTLPQNGIQNGSELIML